MAKAANFTQTNVIQPSIFELIAQKALDQTLHPALERLYRILLVRTNDQYNYFDEIFLGFNTVLQTYYLKNYDATFAECFYGLKRVFQTGKVLDRTGKTSSFLTVVLIPYLLRKIDKKMQQYRIQEADGQLENKLNRFATRIHSGYKISWNLLLISFYVRYMTGKTEFQSPILWFLNMELIHNDATIETNFLVDLINGKLSLRSMVMSTFELLAFFLQFLQVWSADQSQYSWTALPRIGKPMRDPNGQRYLEKCPICQCPWRIPTVLPVSGYVYCFRCIVRYLREHSQCPVTRLPARFDDVIRLFDTH